MVAEWPFFNPSLKFIVFQAVVINFFQSWMKCHAECLLTSTGPVHAVVEQIENHDIGKSQLKQTNKKENKVIGNRAASLEAAQQVPHLFSKISKLHRDII